MVPTLKNNFSATSSSWLDRGIVLLVGLTISWVGMYLIVVRPLSQQIVIMNANMLEVRGSMESLIGNKHDVFKTNDLLTMLKQQDRLLSGARSSLDQLSEVRQEISSLKNQLVADRSFICNVRETLNEFTQLKADILAQKPSMIDMQVAWNEFKTIQHELVESRSSLASMISTWKQIQSLHHELTLHDQTVKSAATVTNSLLDIEAALAEKTPEMLSKADKTLDQLVEFQLVLDQQSQLVPQSLRNMETLGELELEVKANINRIQNMRRELLDFGLLEQSVKDTLRVLAPVMELTNAKRLSVNDVREVAKNLEARRNAVHVMQPSLVSHHGGNTFEFKPHDNYQWGNSVLDDSALINSSMDELNIGQQSLHLPPAVEMPE